MTEIGNLYKSFSDSEKTILTPEYPDDPELSKNLVFAKVLTKIMQYVNTYRIQFRYNSEMLYVNDTIAEVLKMSSPFFAQPRGAADELGVLNGTLKTYRDSDLPMGKDGIVLITSRNNSRRNEEEVPPTKSNTIVLEFKDIADKVDKLKNDL